MTYLTRMNKGRRVAGRRVTQRGSVVVNFAIAAFVIIVAVLGTEIGVYSFQKRELQKAADLAALSGAVRLQPDSCVAGEAMARSNAAENLAHLAHLAPVTTDVACGRWVRPAEGAPETEDGLVSVGPDDNYDALRVTLTALYDSILPAFSNLSLEAKAVAQMDGPQASFTVGSGVARLNAGALNQLLSLLLGTNVTLSLADYEGLANTNVNLLGLAKALGLAVGTYDELAAADLDVGELLSGTVGLLPRDSVDPAVGVALNALNVLLDLGVPLEQLSLAVLKTASQNGLLSLDLDTRDPSTALDTDVSVLNLLLVGLQVANASDDPSFVSGAINVPLQPLANVGVRAKVIEPPSIGVGPPGYTASGRARTAAHTAVVRVYLNTQVLTPAGGDSLLDVNLLGLARVKLAAPAGQVVNLPIYAEVAPGEAVLESVSCRASQNGHEVTLGVTPGLAHVYLGHIPDAFENRSTRWANLQKDRFKLLNLNLDASLLGVPLLNVPVNLTARLDFSVPRNGAVTRQEVTFDYDPEEPRSTQNLTASVGSQRHLGASIADAIAAGLLDVELDTSGLSLGGADLALLSNIIDGLGNSLGDLLNGVLALLNPVLAPVLTLLDGVLLGPLLEALGLQLGYADVQLMSASCDASAKLVH
ncbi:pilus assembly protein TadG-related protein [Xenophilus arseniciresistens]|uniref:Pilus assembly protein TadG-related protein n=1 Tax=Xenophilus arseniciresistens TaxID=1283306 RepID=A0AAE3NC87_9BURK|nr:pilus assembly protein TadG-related protein [Xenophilus arseniciresistens]MDA7418166.1 pilus assembly protein TadG-related protein [Xenophilus arseniciresistens]